MVKVNIVKEFKGGSMASTFLVDKEGERFIRKVAENKGNLAAKKLKQQWDWLYEFALSEPGGIFPDLSFFVIAKDYSYYDMEYVELPTLRDLIIQEGDYEPGILHDYLRRGSIIARPLPIEAPVTDSYIMDKHIRKMIDRCKDIKQLSIFKDPTILINGVEYKNLLPLLEEITNDNELLKLLRPKKWYRSHGDFTFQNVLTDYDDIVIIDPRGEGPDTIYYDLSKIYQSCHGKYDLLYEGNYRAWQETEGASINYEIFENVELFNDIFNNVKELIPQYYEVEEYWDLITRFYEASHFISMVPFRLKENMQITVICYAIGIEILNKFMEDWENVKNKFKK